MQCQSHLKTPTASFQALTTLRSRWDVGGGKLVSLSEASYLPRTSRRCCSASLQSLLCSHAEWIQRPVGSILQTCGLCSATMPHLFSTQETPFCTTADVLL